MDALVAWICIATGAASGIAAAIWLSRCPFLDALKKSLCPFCRYNLAGLQVNTLCPECGRDPWATLPQYQPVRILAWILACAAAVFTACTFFLSQLFSEGDPIDDFLISCFFFGPGLALLTTSVITLYKQISFKEALILFTTCTLGQLAICFWLLIETFIHPDAQAGLTLLFGGIILGPVGVGYGAGLGTIIIAHQRYKTQAHTSSSE